MDKMKPWQIGLFIAAVVVLGASLAWNMMRGDKLDMSNSITLVDVKTGDLYSVNLSGKRTVLLPARHPETREKTLFPAKREEGQWHLVERYAGKLRDIEGETIKIGGNGEFTPSSGSRTKYVPPSRD